MEKPKLKTWRHYDTWPIFYKIVVGVMIVLLLAVGITTYLNLNALRKAQESVIQARVGNLAVTTMERLINLLLNQVIVVRYIADDETLRDAVKLSSEENSVDSESSISEWRDIEQQWQTATDENGLVKSIVDPQQNVITAQLFRYAMNLPGCVELSVIDRYGILLASTGHTQHYYWAIQDSAATTNWWETIYNNGQGALYIGITERFESEVVEMVVPVYDNLLITGIADEHTSVVSSADGNLIGFVHAVVNLTPMMDSLQAIQLNPNEGLVVVDGTGRVFAGRDEQLIGTSLDSSWLTILYRNRVSHWHEAMSNDGTRVLLGHHFLEDIDIDALLFSKVNVSSLTDAAIEQTLQSLGWGVFVYLPYRDAYAEVRSDLFGGYLLAFGAVLFAGMGTIFVAGMITRPVIQLADEAQKMAAGSANVLAWVYAPDEIGQVATAFNTLLEEKKELRETLNRRIELRELEQAKHERDLEATAAVGALVAAASDMAMLAREVVEVIRERFRLYFVGLFLVDEQMDAQSKKWAVLHAGTGDPGMALLARDYRVEIGIGAVGLCVENVARWFVDYAVVREGPEESEAPITNPELPYTRAEVALPLRSRGQILGVIDLHAYHADDFDEETVTILQTIADQIAVAIDGIRLFAERQEAMERLRRAYGEVSRHAWEEWLNIYAAGVGIGVQANVTGVESLPPVIPAAWPDEARQSWGENRAVLASYNGTQSVRSDADPVESVRQVPVHKLALPVRSRQGIIGVIDVCKQETDDRDTAWTEDEIAQLTQFTEQLGIALENALLYEETQNRAARERLVGEATVRMRETLDIETMLRNAADEIYKALQLEEVVVRLTMDETRKE
ncbi:MAG: GAF domain-containing protein [Anaerolineae bacterium]|nr:GAF domain-containing protein [Anaerolineae bacterium]